MIFSTRGIVLHRFKFSDSKTITKIYTEKFGLQSYLIYGSSSKKAKQIQSLLQPFFLVEMQVYHTDNKGLQKIKEISNSYPFKTVPFDFNKNSIALFLSEFLLKIIQENEADKDLFEFIYNSIEFFDSVKDNFQNFHLIFLLKMCNFLGISPNKNFSEQNAIFNLNSGRYTTGIPQNQKHIDIKHSFKFNELLSANFKSKININNSERRILLSYIIDFYTIHLGKPGELKSLDVLKEIF